MTSFYNCIADDTEIVGTEGSSFHQTGLSKTVSRENQIDHSQFYESVMQCHDFFFHRLDALAVGKIVPGQ